MSLRGLVALLVGAVVMIALAATQLVMLHWQAGRVTVVSVPPVPSAPSVPATFAGAHAATAPSAGGEQRAAVVTTIPPTRTGGPTIIAVADGPVWQPVLLSLATAAVIALTSMALVGVVLRRPIGAILAAIEDIERGAPPPLWRFRTPSELGTIAAALAKMGAQLHFSLRERDMMLASLNHDLRSPLARLRATLELRAEAVDDAELRLTLTEVDAITHVVAQCVDYARDGRDEPLLPDNVDRIVDQAMQYQPDVLRQLSSPEVLPLRVLAVERAVRNLVDNARRHGAVPIRITTSSSERYVEIVVEDAGNGITEAEWPALLQPFVRRTTAADGGSGLGLAIAQRVARAHGGELLMRARTHDHAFAVVLRLMR